MKAEERKEIKEIVEAAKFLAEYDPNSLIVGSSNMNILKTRCEYERAKMLEAQKKDLLEV